MIRRMTRDDAQAVSKFLGDTFAADPESGGKGAPPEDILRSQAEGGIWLAEEGGKLIGELGPATPGQRLMEDGSVATFVLFTCLVVDYSLYESKQGEALKVAGELTIAAADEIQAGGKPPDAILVIGPTASRGASWCRHLGMKEEVKGKESWFWLDFKAIWDAVAKAVK